jgi:hypothetical protein
LRLSRYVILLTVSFIIIVGIWERAQSIELFILSLIMLFLGILVTHRRVQRAA